MVYQITSCFLLTVVLAPFLGATTARDGRPDDDPCEGTVVLANATHLVMRVRTLEVQVAKTNRYRLAPNAKVTCDGMLCSLENLQPGQKVRVTARAVGEQRMASWVEALDE